MLANCLNLLERITIVIQLDNFLTPSTYPALHITQNLMITAIPEEMVQNILKQNIKNVRILDYDFKFKLDFADINVRRSDFVLIC